METCDVCGEEVSTLVVCPDCKTVMCEDCVNDWHGTTDGDVCPKWTKDASEE